MNKFLKFFINISIVIFLLALLLVYAFLPDPLGILFDKNGSIVYDISKGAFFYTALFMYVIIQIILILFKRESGIKLNVQRPYLKTWFQGFHLAVNMFIILMLLFVGLANNAVDYSYGSIMFLVYLAPLIVVVWLVVLPVLIILKRS
jgi:hypothetical protein